MTKLPSPSEPPENLDSLLPDNVPWQPVLPDETPLEVFIWQPDVDALNALLFEPVIGFPISGEKPDDAR